MQPCPPQRPAPTGSPATTGWGRVASRALHPSLPRLDDGWLWAVVSGLASVASPWELQRPDERTEAGAELVLATPLYEAWLQSWPVGAGSDAHPHPDPAAFCVVAGTLDELDHDGPGATLLGSHGPGQGRVVPSGERHLLRNRATRPATSVHVTLPRG